MDRLDGTYSGVVKENRDPLKLGRIKVFVPAVFGVGGPVTEEVGLENIPWALPIGLPAGGSAESGGIDWLPTIGDAVWVRFLDGEPEKPLWEWAMQTIDQQKALPLHDYDSITDRPKRAALTRYGHTLDFTAGAVVLTTKGGYSIALTDSSEKKGKISVKGPSNHVVEIDDSQKTITLLTSSGQIVQVDDNANSITMLANETMEAQAGEEISMSGGQIKLEALGEGITLTGFSQIKLTVGARTLTINQSTFNFS